MIVVEVIGGIKIIVEVIVKVIKVTTKDLLIAKTNEHTKRNTNSKRLI